jgi:hypothetical protein
MSDDGQPLIWQVYDGSLFLAINRKAAPFGLAAYRQYKSFLSEEDLERIFDEATLKRFEKKIQRTQSLRDQLPKDFDFGGILPRHVIEGKKAVSLRKSVEALFDEVIQMTNLQSDYANWVRACVIALEPVIHDSPFVRDTDIEELVDTLYDDLMMESNEKASKVETFQQDTKIAEFLDHMERLHQTREKVFSVMKANKEIIIRAYPFTIHDVAEALNMVQPNAPRELVFKAFTDPKLYSQWLGPRRLTTKFEKLEAKNGGSYRFINEDGKGNKFAFHGVYHEVLSPERIIGTFEYEGLPGKGHVSLEITKLEELPRRQD